MAMKVQTKRWVFAVGVAGSLLAILFYLDRSAPAAQFTHVAPVRPAFVMRSAAVPAALSAAPAPLPVAEPLRERYIVQAGSSGEPGPRGLRSGAGVSHE